MTIQQQKARLRSDLACLMIEALKREGGLVFSNDEYVRLQEKLEDVLLGMVQI